MCAISSGANIVRSGLILDLDIANRKSHIDALQSSLFNVNSWTVGTGSCSGFNANGEATEDNRMIDTDPWGNATVVWESRSLGTNNNDGGFHTSYYPIDRSKMYRSCVWMRRTTAAATGSYYHGCHTNGTGDTLDLSNDSSQTNPYWSYGGTNLLTQGVWYLCVGHMFPSTWKGTTANPNTGIYSIATGAGAKALGNPSNCPNDIKFPSDATTMMQRTYHYYGTDVNTRIQFCYPRIDLCDGSEPSIADLLSQDSSMIYDTSGYGNHHNFSNGTSNINPVISKSPTKASIDESFYIGKSGYMNGAGATCTVQLWYSTTDIQELWCRGRLDGAYYLSAAYSGSNYYHSNCGSPTNWVDCKSCIDPIAEGYKDGKYHMFEAKNVDFTNWNYFQWWGYGAAWNMVGNVSRIMVYNRNLTAAESKQNHAALRGRFGI
jgi:hypothetical protein